MKTVALLGKLMTLVLVGVDGWMIPYYVLAIGMFQLVSVMVIAEDL